MFEVFFFSVGQFFAYTWWLILFLILAPLTASAWLFYRQESFKQSDNYRPILLELLIPREINKSPRGMEQVLAAMHALRNAPGNLQETWIDGEVVRPFSLEIVSFGGEIHFYIRVYFKLRPLVEAAIFSYYPDVEVIEVEDYVERFPKTLTEMYAQGYDFWGGEMALVKPAAYPIKSYLDFESPDEEKQYDPIATFLEILGQVQPQQIVAIQILIEAAPPDWHKKWSGLVDKLRQSQNAEQVTKAKKTAQRTWDFSSGPLPVLGVKAPDNKDDMSGLSKMLMRSPGETDVLKAVEANLSKPAFNTLIRFLYFSPNEKFYDSFPRRGIAGAFNQYAAQDLNAFAINYPASTRTNIWSRPHLFPNRRNEAKKREILYNYRNRETPPETFIGLLITSSFFNWNKKHKIFELSTQSLATIFHPPTNIVLTAPHIRRVESRKAGPPAGLAIFGEEKELERFN